MKQKLIKFTMLLLFSVGILSVYAANEDKAIWEKKTLVDTEKMDQELREELVIQIKRILKAGHLKPFYAQRGEGGGEYYFTNPGDIVWVLARSYPYLPSEIQREVKIYLQKEMKEYPPCSGKMNEPANPGSFRQLHEWPDEAPNWKHKIKRYGNRPRLHNIYAVWLYAENTGDWAYVKDNWQSIQSFFNTHLKDADIYAGGAAGAIAFARLADKMGDANMKKTAVQIAEKGLKAMEKDDENSEAMRARYRKNPRWETPFNHFAQNYLHMTPEVGRYIRENPQIKEKIVKRTASGVHHWPMWYISQASAFMRYYGEGHALPPMLSATIWPVKVHVEQVPPKKMRVLLDAEDAYIGDLIFLNKLVDVLESEEKEQWISVKDD